MESAGPDPPALRESAWARAKTDANRVYRSPLFGIALALVGLMATSLGVLFTVGSTVSTGTQVAVPLLSGTAAIAITFLIVLVLQTASAPLRQRNELRQSWPVGPIHEPPNVELRYATTFGAAKLYKTASMADRRVMIGALPRIGQRK